MSEGYRRVFNLEQVYVRVGEHYDEIHSSLCLPLLDSSASLDEETTFRLALVTAFQYAESIDDPAAALATTQRREWRYALHLPDRHPGFSAAMLCRFRASLYFSIQATREMEQIFSSLKKMGLFSVQSEVQEGEEVITRVCGITHFMQVKRMMKTALSTLAAVDPLWLRANAKPHWYDRYKTGRLDLPAKLSDLEIYKEAVRLGRDIQYLIETLNAQGMTCLADQPEIQILAKVLESDFVVMGDQMAWRAPMRATCSCVGLGQDHRKLPS